VEEVLSEVYSLESYRSIIRRALSAGYTFAPFSAEKEVSGRRIYLRHDVDYSLEMALKLAEANAELGIQGTFCVLLRSQVYNLLSQPSIDAATRIHDLGQNIGLHVPLSSMLLRDDDYSVEAKLRADFEFLREEVPVLSPVYSWHNPTPETLERYLPYPRKAGLVNTYSSQFFRDIPYYSDSNLRHSVEAFKRFVADGEVEAMQIVFHPLYWVGGGTSMRDVLSRAWCYIIREREREIRLNRFYAQVLPDGMPESVLREFAERWREATEREPVDGRPPQDYA
jgi:hypothetical protein